MVSRILWLILSVAAAVLGIVWSVEVCWDQVHSIRNHFEIAPVQTGI